MALSSRAVATLGWLLTAVSLTAFVALMLAGRGSRGELPAWNPARFALLEGSRAATASETWMIAVNPGCPHCRASLPEVVARAHRERPEPALAMLLVDAPERLVAESLAVLPVSSVWWDSLGIWRRGWKRTEYGEILVFDPNGHLVRTLPPAIAAAATP